MSDDCKPAPGQDLPRVLTMLRDSRKLSRQDLSRLSGVAGSNLSQYELGSHVPELKTLRRLLQALGYPLAAIEITERYLATLDGLRASVPNASDPSERIEVVASEAARAAYQWTRSCLSLLLEQRPASAETGQAEKSPEAIGWVEASEEPPTEEWAQLAALPLEAFRSELARRPERVAPLFVEWLGARSEARAAGSLPKAKDDARRALVVAERLAPSAAHPLVALAQAYLGNAFRVANETAPAEAAFARSEEVARTSPLPPRLEARRLDLLASFHRDYQRFDLALSALDRALVLDPERLHAGRIRMKKAKTLAARVDLEIAIEELRGAAGESDAREPRLLLCLRHNLADYLSKLDRFAEAEALVPEVRDLARRHGGEIDRVRLLWIEGRIAAGLGSSETATAKLGQVRGEFLRRDMFYDAALAALELASIYLREGRTAQVRDLARQMLPVFAKDEIHREAFAAITLFRQAAEQERATLAFAERLSAFLLAARGNPGLRFEAAGG